MTNSVLYYVISLLATFYLCYGVSSNQPLSSHGQPGNVMISILSVKSKVGTTGTSCAIKPRTSTTSTKRNNIRETFFTRMNEHNTEAFNLLNQLWHSKSGWQHVNTKEGVSVERRSLPAGTFVDSTDASKGSKHACVRSSGVIKASPQSVIDLFLDNSRVAEYNEHVIQVKDIMVLPRKSGDDSWTKLSWAAGPKYGPFKARDFASVVNFKRFNNGTFMIINRPAYHPDYPPTKKYVRATTLLVGNIIEPFKGKLNEEYTRITQVAHVNPGGAGDTAAVAYVINKLCAVGPPNFIRKLELAAQKSDFMKLKSINNDKNNQNSFKIPALFDKDFKNIQNEWSKLNIPDFFGKKKLKNRNLAVTAFINSAQRFWSN